MSGHAILTARRCLGILGSAPLLNRTLKAPPIRGLMEPRQSGLFPVSDGFILRGFGQADKSFEIPSREGGAADVERRPAGVRRGAV